MSPLAYLDLNSTSNQINLKFINLSYCLCPISYFVFSISLTVPESQHGENRLNFLSETLLTIFVLCCGVYSFFLSLKHKLVRILFCLFLFSLQRTVSKAYCILLKFAASFPLLTNCRSMHFSFDPLGAYLNNISGILNKSRGNDVNGTLFLPTILIVVLFVGFF